MVGKELFDSMPVEEFRGGHSGESMLILVAFQAKGYEIQDISISFTHRTKVSILSQFLGWDPQKTGHFSAKDLRDRAKRAMERANSCYDSQEENKLPVTIHSKSLYPGP